VAVQLMVSQEEVSSMQLVQIRQGYKHVTLYLLDQRWPT
jgi:hypothetical protein